MKITLKIKRALLDEVRLDLAREHSFAHERVGFLVAAAASVPGGLLLIACAYQPVADEDYEPSASVGAQIGSDAMRKAVNAAFRPQRALLHVHSHGGYGTPSFSSVDERSAAEFVPGFLHPVPGMPHGLLVLSDDSATGLCWRHKQQKPEPITEFVAVGAPYARDWRPR